MYNSYRARAVVEQLRGVEQKGSSGSREFKEIALSVSRRWSVGLSHSTGSDQAHSNLSIVGNYEIASKQCRLRLPLKAELESVTDERCTTEKM